MWLNDLFWGRRAHFGGKLSLGDKWALWRALSALWTNPPKKSWQGAEPPPPFWLLGAYEHPTHPLCTLLLLHYYVKNKLMCLYQHARCNTRAFTGSGGVRSILRSRDSACPAPVSARSVSQQVGRISLFKRRLNGNKFLDSVWWPFHFPQTSLLRFILWSSEFFLAPAGVKPEEIWAFDRHTTIIKVLENSKVFLGEQIQSTLVVTHKRF